MRYPILDGFRGFFLLFMMIIHANEVLQATIGKLNHHYFGWVQDAQGFVFISGFVVAMVYGKAFDRFGFAACVSVTYSRIRTIYTYQASLIIIMLATALLLPAAFDAGPLGVYTREPIWFTVSSLTLTSASMHMGILPMYIYFMAALPFVIVALSRGYWFAVLVGSIVIWLIGQTRLLPFAVRELQEYIQYSGVDIRLGLFFNLLSWQILFFGGAILGYLLNRQQLPLHIFKTPQVRAAALVSFLALVLLGVFNRLVFADILPEEWQTWYMEANARRHFSTLHLLAFIFALFFVSWLFLEGQSDKVPLFRWLNKVGTSLVGHPKLIFLGQHSLQVFSFHLLVVYGLHLVIGERELGELPASAILIGCVASLFIPARLHAISQARKRAFKAA